MAAGVKRARRPDRGRGLVMAISVVNITPAQMAGFRGAMVQRMARHVAGFLAGHKAPCPPVDLLETWARDAMASGFEITEDIVRFMVLRTRCEKALFSRIMIEPDVEPVVRLFHMEAEHPDLWSPMIDDLG